MQGHDAKFHGLANKVARGQAAMPQAFVNEDARAYFLKHHDAERAANEAKAVGKAEPPQGRQRDQRQDDQPAAEGDGAAGHRFGYRLDLVVGTSRRLTPAGSSMGRPRRIAVRSRGRKTNRRCRLRKRCRGRATRSIMPDERAVVGAISPAYILDRRTGAAPAENCQDYKTCCMVKWRISAKRGAAQFSFPGRSSDAAGCLFGKLDVIGASRIAVKSYWP